MAFEQTSPDHSIEDELLDVNDLFDFDRSKQWGGWIRIGSARVKEGIKDGGGNVDARRKRKRYPFEEEAERGGFRKTRGF